MWPRRWQRSAVWPASKGSGPPSATTGRTPCHSIRLAAAGHGLVLLPETALPGSSLPGGPLPGWRLTATGITAVPVTTPRVVHRVELVHGTLRGGSPAAELAALLAALA